MSRFGPILDADGVTFRLWAPAAREIKLVLDRALPMQKRGEWFETRVAGAGAGRGAMNMPSTPRLRHSMPAA